MGLEENKQIVRDYFSAVNRGDERAILNMTTEDFLFQTMARAPEWLLPKWGMEDFAKVPATMSGLMKAPINLTIAGMIAEGERVAVEAETDGEMLNGRRYNNRYHFVFELRAGKMCGLREYSCSHLAQTCFGAIEPSDPSKSAMAD